MKNFIKIVIFLSMLITTAGAKDKITTATNPIQLQDIGIHFDPKTLSDKEANFLYNERASKLELHPKMGKITAGLMLASFLTAQMARAKRGNINNAGNGALKIHKNLSYFTAISYYTTAYLSLSAPKPIDFEDDSQRIWHKRLAYIHFPIMILAPIIGTIAYNQIQKNGKVSGIGKLQRPMMYIGSAAFLSAYLVMDF